MNKGVIKWIIIASAAGGAVAALSVLLRFEESLIPEVKEEVLTESPIETTDGRDILTGQGEVSGHLINRNANDMISDFQTREVDGGLMIDYCFSDDEVIKIPEEINGQKVVSIGRFALARRKCVEIIIPDTVVKIDEKAFINCENLESVKMGSGLKKIEAGAFAGCHLLKAVDFPEDMESIADNVFVENEKLTEVKISGMKTKASKPIDVWTCSKAVIVTPAGSETDKEARKNNQPVTNI